MKLLYWYHHDIEWLERKQVSSNSLKKVVFYGSSTFTLWDKLESEFDNFQAVNLGFGGSTLAACTWFFPRVVPKHKPDIIVVYAGDNDLGDGRTPEEVVIFYKQLLANVHEHLGNIPVFFISIKLSPARKHLKGSIDYTNYTIKNYIGNNPQLPLYYIDTHSLMLDAQGAVRTELYKPDGLHISEEGYKIWKKAISSSLESCLVS